MRRILVPTLATVAIALVAGLLIWQAPKWFTPPPLRAYCYYIEDVQGTRVLVSVPENEPVGKHGALQLILGTDGPLPELHIPARVVKRDGDHLILKVDDEHLGKLRKIDRRSAYAFDMGAMIRDIEEQEALLRDSVDL